MMVMRGVLLAVALLLAAGCSSPLDPPRASRVEGVPIPNNAVDIPREPFITREGKPIYLSTPETFAGYRIPGASFRQLWRWYEREMPQRQDWRTWPWCEQDDPSTIGSTYGGQKVYYRSRTNQMLLIIIMEAREAGRPRELGVLIGVHEAKCP
jgi:hypothetical protein